MNDKQKTILNTAIDVFLRYGIRRSTMGDIAEQAGISRQTLYASFAKKDDIVAAAIDHLTTKTIKNIKDNWLGCTKIEDKIDVYFNYAVIEYFALIQTMPDANDLLTGFSRAGEAALADGEAKKTELLEKELASELANPNKTNITAYELADFIQRSSSGFKYSATDSKHLSRLLESLKSSVLLILKS